MLALLFAAAGVRSAPAAVGSTDSIPGPPWFQENLVYYRSFDGAADPVVNTDGISQAEKGASEVIGDGSFGQGRLIHSLTLQGAVLSPHQPRTVSFWWALPKDLAIDGGFSLFGITGGGYIGAFCRGKGEWCALQRPAGVLQVQYFPGIQNVNGIYDFDLLSHLDLHARQWHHTAEVFRQGSSVQLYTDGKRVTEVNYSGRTLTEKDQLTTLSLGTEGGNGLLIDEIAILDRAIDGDLVADYYQGASRLREYHGNHGR